MNVCLLAFHFKVSTKEERIIRILGDFHKLFRIKNISSVYKKTSDETTTRLDEEMSFAITTETALNVENLLAAKTALQGSDFKVELLVYNYEIQWTPELPLPSPLLHFDPLVLHCCAEIAPTYIHPILKDNLKTLDINNIRTDFEFLFQGKIYIDQLT
jgi:hypothetical protein